MILGRVGTGLLASAAACACLVCGIVLDLRCRSNRAAAGSAPIKRVRRSPSDPTVPPLFPGRWLPIGPGGVVFDRAMRDAPLGPGRWLPIAPLRLVADSGQERIDLAADGAIRLRGIAAGRVVADDVLAVDGHPTMRVTADGRIALDSRISPRLFLAAEAPRIAPDGTITTRLGDFAVLPDGVPTITRSGDAPLRVRARFLGYHPRLRSTALTLMLFEIRASGVAEIPVPAP